MQMKVRRSTIAPFSCVPDCLSEYVKVYSCMFMCVCVSVVAYDKTGANDRTQKSSSPACDPHKTFERVVCIRQRSTSLTQIRQQEREQETLSATFFDGQNVSVCSVDIKIQMPFKICSCYIENILNKIFQIKINSHRQQSIKTQTVNLDWTAGRTVLQSLILSYLQNITAVE